MLKKKNNRAIRIALFYFIFVILKYFPQCLHYNIEIYKNYERNLSQQSLKHFCPNSSLQIANDIRSFPTRVLFTINFAIIVAGCWPQRVINHTPSYRSCHTMNFENICNLQSFSRNNLYPNKQHLHLKTLLHKYKTVTRECYKRYISRK